MKSCSNAGIVNLLLLLALCLPCAAVAQKGSSACEKLIPAMKLEATADESHDNRRRVLDDLLSDKYKNFADIRRKYESFLGFFDGGAIDYTGDQSNQTFEAWRERLRRVRDEESIDTGSLRLKVETLADKVVEAFTACVTARHSGLHIWATVNPRDPTQFTLQANYETSNDNHPKVRLSTDIQFNPTGSATCLANPVLRKGGLLGSSIQGLNCTRTNQAQDIAVQLNASGAGSRPAEVRGVAQCSRRDESKEAACQYPMTGRITFLRRYCDGGKAFPAPLDTERNDSQCRPTACRNAEDIVAALTKGMMAVELRGAEAQSYVQQLKDGAATVKGLMGQIVADDRFYNRVIPDWVRSLREQRLFARTWADPRNPQDLAIDLVRQVREWGLGLTQLHTETLRYIAFYDDGTAGSFAMQFSKARVVNHARIVLAHPDFNGQAGISGDNQIPPALARDPSGQPLRYSPDPGSCVPTR
jgi:hypothetical protein